MSRVVRVVSVGLHPEAECEECGKRWGSSGATRALAKDHAQQTGHAVIVETVTRDLYRKED